jgi:hypothetical protein
MAGIAKPVRREKRGVLVLPHGVVRASGAFFEHPLVKKGHAFNY